MGVKFAGIVRIADPPRPPNCHRCAKHLCQYEAEIGSPSRETTAKDEPPELATYWVTKQNRQLDASSARLTKDSTRSVGGTIAHPTNLYDAISPGRGLVV